MNVEEHYHGLSGWVSDYKVARANGNVRLAKQLRDSIKHAIQRYSLDAARVWGADPEAPVQGVYGEWCHDPTLCAGKGYCPRDPTCAD